MKLSFQKTIFIFAVVLFLNILLSNIVNAQESNESITRTIEPNVHIPFLNITLQRNILLLSAVIFLIGLILVLIPWAVMILYNKFKQSPQLTFHEKPTVANDIDISKLITPIKEVTKSTAKLMRKIQPKKIKIIPEKNKHKDFIEP